MKYVCEKQKKVVAPMGEKLCAIKRLDSGESAKKDSGESATPLELGIRRSTIGDWKKPFRN